MRIIVQKFGGTSVATPERQAAVVRRIQEALSKGYVPVVVVSAMGRRGEPYATDTLLDLVGEVPVGTAERELDLLLACGETISAVVLATRLKQLAGIEKVVVLTGRQAGIVTDGNYGNARILRVEPDHARRHLERGDLIVVAGFQGATEAGDITTLGRGGSDTTAAALGVALRAELVEIYSDVDGIKTADPQIVPEAQTLQTATYEEVLQMATEGARVIHPRAVELAMRANVPLRVRGTFSSGEGTMISHGYENWQWLEADKQKLITAVTHIAPVDQISVSARGGDPGEDVAIFRPLADAGISLDLFNVSPDRKSFIASPRDADRVEHILEAAGFRVERRSGCAKVSVVGSSMQGVPGVMAKMAEALAREQIGILQTSDSHITISCLVLEKDLERSVRALHKQFGLNNGGELG